MLHNTGIKERRYEQYLNNVLRALSGNLFVRQIICYFQWLISDSSNSALLNFQIYQTCTLFTTTTTTVSFFFFPPSSHRHSTPCILEAGLYDEPISVPGGRSAVVEWVEDPLTWLISDRSALLVREIQIDHDYCHALETRWDKMRWKWRLRAKVIPINQNMIESTRQLNQSPYLLCNITPYLI